MKNEIFIVNEHDVGGYCENAREPYEYKRKCIVPDSEQAQCVVSVYEVPPGKSAYPYHYHTQNTEVFFILSGSGLLVCPGGEKRISRGDFAVCPQGEAGAHKIVNDSETELLKYIDFDTNNSPDVIRYPDSGKTGVVCGGVNTLFFDSDSAGYYDGE